MAFLTIITRSFRRPESLARCVQSVARQTDPDVEQRIIHDPVGSGVEASYVMLRDVVPSSEYVMLLDDDDYLIEPSFVAELKKLAEERGKPDVIFVSMDVSGTVMPNWDEGLRRGWIACSCFVVKRPVWMKHAPDFKADYSADFYFIDDIYNWYDVYDSGNGYRFAHLNMIASRVGKVSRGKPE